MIEVGAVIAGLSVNLSQHRSANAVLTETQINIQQGGINITALQLRCQCFTHIEHRRKGGNNQRQWRGDGSTFTILLPGRAHGHRIFAHRNSDAQGRAQFHADGFHRTIKLFVFTFMACGTHPVGGQFNIGQLANATRGNIGQ